MKRKCRLCNYIEIAGGGFPFGYERKRYYIDSEGCFYGKSKITIKYCPSCGKLLEKND